MHKFGVERIIEVTQGKLPARLFVLAGPSGVGKYTITQGLLKSFPEMQRVVTFTTRAPRPEEVEGDQYHFISREEFVRKAEAGLLLEKEGIDVYGEGHLYSMPADLMTNLQDGKFLVLAEVDINGTRLLKELFPACTAIFVTAPPVTLLQRIRERNGDSHDLDLNKRLATAREQMQAASALFDYIVFNEGDLDHTVEAVEAIIRAERMRVREGVNLAAMLPDDAFDDVVKEIP